VVISDYIRLIVEVFKQAPARRVDRLRSKKMRFNDRGRRPSPLFVDV